MDRVKGQQVRESEWEVDGGLRTARGLKDDKDGRLGLVYVNPTWFAHLCKTGSHPSQKTGFGWNHH